MKRCKEMCAALTCSICCRGRCGCRNLLLALRLHIVQRRRKVHLTVGLNHRYGILQDGVFSVHLQC